MRIHKLKQKLVSYCVFINLKIKSLGFLVILIKIINALVLGLCIIQQEILGYVKQTSYEKNIKIFYSIIRGLYVHQLPINEIGFVMAALLTVILICVILYISQDTYIKGVSKKLTFLTYTAYMPIVIILLVETMFVTISYFYIESFLVLSQHHIDFRFAFILIGFILHICISVYNYQNRLLSGGLILFCISLLVFPQIVSFIGLFIYCVILNYLNADLVQKCLSRLLLVVFCFRMVESSFKVNEISSLIYLGVGMFSMLIGNVCNSDEINPHRKDQCNNQYLVKCLQKLEMSAPSHLPTKMKILVDSILCNFMDKKKDSYAKQVQMEKLKKKGIKSLSYDEFVKLVDYKVTRDYEDCSNDVNMKKILLLLRIKNNYKIHQTLTQISEILDLQNLRNAKLSMKQIYIRKNLEVVIFEQFLSKYGGTEKIEEMIQISIKQRDFVKKSMEVYSNISTFWERIRSDVLIEKIVEDSLLSILEDMKNIKKLYENLKVGYKAIWQSQIICILSKLMQPFTLISNNVDQHHGKRKEIKESSLNFFVLRNKNIISTSSHFLKVVNLAFDEVLNQSISKIAPREVAKTIGKREQQSLKYGHFSSILPILSDESTIHVYMAHMKLQPKPNSGIEFFYQLTNYEKDENLAFLYLNSIDLCVKHVSEEFYEIFGLSQDYAKCKIEKKDFYLNNMITNFQPGLIIPQLISKKTLRCDFSVKSLKAVQRHKKKSALCNGSLNLIASYNDEILVSVFLSNDKQYETDLRQKMSNKTSLNIMTTQNQKFDGFKMVTFIDMESEDGVKQEGNDGMDDIYCPLVNPYKQKIEQKQIEMSTQSKNNILSLSFCAIVLLVLMIIVLIMIPTCLYMFSQQRRVKVQQAFKKVDESTVHSNALVYNTFVVYFQYFLSNNKHYFEQFPKKFPITNLYKAPSFDIVMKYSYGSVASVQKIFQNAFITFNRKQSHEAYELKFQDFVSKADFSKSNLIDYSYNLKLASQRIRLQLQKSNKEGISFKEAQGQSHPLEFLANNFQSVSSLKAPFQQLRNLDEATRKRTFNMNVTIGGLSIGFALLLLLLWFILIKSTYIVKDIFFIFSMTEKLDIQQRLEQISIATEIYENQVPKDNLQKIKELEKEKTIKMIIYNNRVRKSMKDLKDESFEQEDVEKEKRIIHSQDNTLVATFLLLKGIIIGSSIYFTFLFFFYYRMYVHFQEDSINLMFFNQMKFLKNVQYKNTAEMMHYNILRDQFNRSDVYRQDVDNMQSSVDRKLSGKYSSSFVSFYEMENRILRENMCKNNTAFTSKNYAQLLDCDKIGSGIMKEGYIQSSEYLNTMTRKLIEGSMGLLDVAQQQVYPAVLIHINAKTRIFRQIDSAMLALRSNKVLMDDEYNLTVKTYAILCYVTCVILLLYGFFFFIPEMGKIKVLGIGYFKLFSGETFGKMKTSSYMHQKNLLARISYL